MDWLNIFVGDKTEQRKKRRKKLKKKIAKMKANPGKDTKEDIIKNKKLGYKAVKAQRKKKRMLKDAGK